ncbi:MAG: c-type cytochrome [Pseudolabrys sp.]
MRFLAVAAATAAIAVAALGTTVAWSQQNPIEARQGLMKLNGRHAGVVARMTRGDDPFDAAKVNAAFDQWADTAAKFPALFPDNSKTGDTRALPAVWTERAKFDAAIAKFGKDVADNRAKAAANLDGLKAAMAAVGRNCGSCHETFRKPQ